MSPLAMSTPPDIKLLQAEADDDAKSFFRLLVDGKYVKYLTIDPGIYSTDDLCFEPALISLLPPLPRGDWNTGLISKSQDDGKPVLTTEKADLDCVAKTWHPVTIDHLSLTNPERLRSNVVEATCPSIDPSRRVVAKFARFEWEMGYLDDETEAYQWIDGKGIGPEFLGHLTEDGGRVIGFVVARVDDCHHATPQDLPQCRAALSRLHDLGIKHGDTNKHNFLVSDGGKVTLIDFEGAVRNASDDDMRMEMEGLQGCLEDTSRRGGPAYVVHEDPFA